MNAVLDRFRSGNANEGRSLSTYLLLIGAGFVGLWLLLQFVPASTPPPVVSDEAGTIAATPSVADAEAFSLLTPGRIAVILLLIAGGAWAIYLNRRSPSTAPDAPMHSLGRLALSQNQHLRLIRCNDEVLLLGVGADEVTLLKSYPREDFPAAGVPPPHADAEAPPTRGDGAAALQPSQPARFADVLRTYAQFTAQ